MNNSADYEFIKLNTVLNITKLSRSTVYSMMALDEFPKPFKVGKRAVSWLRHEIVEWLQRRIEQNRAEYN